MYDELARHREASRNRTMVLLLGFALMAVLAVMRLSYLQLLHADDYRKQIDKWLVLPEEYPPALRGAILDRNGSVLAQDAPNWQVEVYYGLLDSQPDFGGQKNWYIRRLAVRRLRATTYPSGKIPAAAIQQAEESVHQAVSAGWQGLADLSGTATWQILQNAEQVVTRVRAIHQHVTEANGLEPDTREQREFLIREQRQFHPVLTDLPNELARRIEEEITDKHYTWLRVRAGTGRHYADHPSIAPLLGRLTQVSPDDLNNDPNEADELLRLEPGEKVGRAGIEYAAETMLRGRRGKIVRNRAEQDLTRIEPVAGRDVRLTIDSELQQWIYQRLEKAVRANASASGAAAVVLDTQTREALAVVSWPGYTYEQLTDVDGAARLIKDWVHTPLLPRAVRVSYPPGSIVKPVAGLAALSCQLSRPDERIECQGHLFSDSPNTWRCWTAWRHAPPHGPVNFIEALQHSCNIYFYTMGQRLGVERLCHYLSLFGVGRSAGTGLREETGGNLPTEEFLAKLAGRNLTKNELLGNARRYGIGQGELELTPVQAANLGATIATGSWRPVTLLRERPAPESSPLPIPGEYLREAREGMYLVVNSPAGTAYHYARSEGVTIAGKTGTAETYNRAYAFGYDVTMHDDVVETMEFNRPDEARAEFTRLGESVVSFKHAYTKWWPWAPGSENGKPTHAWFMGFAPYDNPRIAVAVIIEYGGGGGKVAGPVARDIFEHYFGVEGRHNDTVDVPTE